MESNRAQWRDQNQRYLMLCLQGVRSALERHTERARSGQPKEPPHSLEVVPVPQINPAPALEGISSAFGLSPFERNILLLCAGMELDAAFPAACAAAQGDEHRPFPTFSLALAALPDGHWSALAPQASLRRNALIQTGEGASLTMCPLRIDERILHYLCGINLVDDRLTSVLDASIAETELVPSHRAIADRIAAAWRQSGGKQPAAIQLCGVDTHAKRSIATAVCSSLGLGLLVVNMDALPQVQSEMETTVRLLEREAILFRSAIMIDCEDIEASDSVRMASARRLIERLRGAVLIATRERRPSKHRTVVTLDVNKPEIDEQRMLWRSALGDAGEALNGTLRELGAQFDVNAKTIQAAALEARAELASMAGDSSVNPKHTKRDLSSAVTEAVWKACRAQARPRLDDLAQRIESKSGWDDLVLPEAQKGILKEIAAHVRRRAVVYEDWGFASRGRRGLGISALFAGTSGTGKTMAAEVIANELDLDLYRIDLSSTVSKYIGETEKNLARVFDAAEEGGAVLLFDEADALFGKRSEVKDSHDRYANIEVSYLLQRMESYRGLAVLTTNLKSSVDTAFMRRLRFVVQFPFPDAAHRAEIWSRIFPESTPTEGLDAGRLAQLAVSGGNIRNTALNAAFVAADAGEPVRMCHVLRAAHSEYAKLEKTLTDAEVAGWL